MNLQVIKIGGNVIDNPEELKSFLQAFASVQGPKILVHGGGKLATRMAEKLGVATEMINGRRVTSPEMLDIAVMMYAGLLNKQIVGLLQKSGCDAAGVCGADGHCVTSVKRSPEPINYGQVGDVTGINTRFFSALFEIGVTPVVCAITADLSGQLLNTNADSVASAIAKGMSYEYDTSLIYCFEKSGVMGNVDDESTLIQRLTPTLAHDLIENGTIQGGMIPKVTNALDIVVNTPVKSVIIKSSRNLLNDFGTLIEND